MGSKNLLPLLDEFSIVIQEYFQARVDAFLNTVGRDIFGTEHCWGRFEFASGRGQIHFHMLAIIKDQHINRVFYDLQKDKKAQAKFVQEWSKQKFGYTAEVDKQAHESAEVSSEDNPSQVRFGDVDDKDADRARMFKFAQTHHPCNAYCLRCTDKNCKRRTCRVGAGQEANAGCGDTPGFFLRSEPTITTDKRGYLKLELKRNHRRIIQSSTDLMDTWRGNCDIKLLLYNCDPDNPDPSEIARVTDYLVSYTCKGNDAIREEKEQFRATIMWSVCHVCLASKSMVAHSNCFFSVQRMKQEPRWS